jgi:acid phosphatase
LAFLKSWKPVLTNPEGQISLLSLGGYKELYDMGVDYRLKYPSFYKENEPFVLWANKYSGPRVIDSARLFARGYLGPNATDVGKVYAINATDPRSVANSLAASDLCKNYSDDPAGNSTTWANIYLPPIVERINKRLSGLTFNTSDINIFPYLCGFETQITGKRSPWCDVFTEDEILQYEYAQDIRYYYGTGPGTELESNLMLPFITAIIERFTDGPNATYTTTNQTTPFRPNRLIATFANDGQISQIAAGTGVFDSQEPLPIDRILTDRIYKATNVNPMKGTVGFERLNCGSAGHFMRIKFNDAVYPVAKCQSGPGKSCPLSEYSELIAGKSAAFGDWQQQCGNDNSTRVPNAKTTFLKDLGLPFMYTVKP